MQRLSRFLLTIFIILTLAGAPVVLAQEDELDDLLQSYLDEYVAPDDPGVVMLVSAEDETWIGVAGLADLEAGTPMQTSDHFRIASISKTYVATVVLQLVDEGIIGLDDPISEWLEPEIVAGIVNGDEITVRQLLSMTSGIFNYTESDAFYAAVEENPTYAWTAEETVAFAFNEEQYFPPGEGYYYSNTNYNLLQIIIETATGNSLADELQTRIFEPVGMSESYLEKGTALGEGLVTGYDDVDGDGVLDDITLINDGIGLGDGGIISTAEDMAKFGTALLIEHELLSEEAWAAMTDGVDDGEGGLYGLGLGINVIEEGAEPAIGHDGATSGFQSELWYDQEYGVLVVILTNHFGTEVVSFDMANEIIEFVVEQME